MWYCISQCALGRLKIEQFADDIFGKCFFSKMPCKKGIKVLPPEERFASYGNDELTKLCATLVNPNRKKADAKCEKSWLTYLSTKTELNGDFDYWLWDEQKLNKYLGKFWFEVKTQDGDHYGVSTLEHLQYSINRCLKRRGHAYNILKSPQFKHSQD